jgi:hypothetical protein
VSEISSWVMLLFSLALFFVVMRHGVEQHREYCQMAADSIASGDAVAAWKKFQVEDGCPR